MKLLIDDEVIVSRTAVQSRDLRVSIYQENSKPGNSLDRRRLTLRSLIALLRSLIHWGMNKP
ncbi:hypothetical protein HMPREF9104_01044 [Lentilactobacillus kisonensis F0435]|uniref:Uncharacterized protein n=1 Tax=Lentilactobacillus kisonensis F0435 TaxID=797516 RepID=H1LEL8_9LACO|nr:hypothetical protein HMPREF9104_01044 [Lentilactobacillus kisonensis F0435]